MISGLPQLLAQLSAQATSLGYNFTSAYVDDIVATWDLVNLYNLATVQVRQESLLFFF